MSNYKTIITEHKGAVSTLWLNRPDKHNALNPKMMHEVIHYFHEIEKNSELRIVVIKGKGASFCAGADLHWMKASANLSLEENITESRLLSNFFTSIQQSSKITIALTHGNIYGGGNGLVAACDLAFGLQNCRFSLSETRIGLIAATITPLMLQRIQPSTYKLLVFSAIPFNGVQAKEMGLLNQVFDQAEALNQYIDTLLASILKGGPKAVAGSKQLINDLLNSEKNTDIKASIPELLATIRVGDEAQEGFTAFVEKRLPKW